MSSSLVQELSSQSPLSREGEVAPVATDRQLLQGFARDHSEPAFRQLIQRHGPMVLGVCRRLLRIEQDVEDAFQAVFLVLARRAGDVRWQDSIGGWLHETAVRVATHARARDLKRREHETRAVDMQTASTEPPDVSGAELGRAELREIFDDEIRQLPRKYQLPLVLCYLEGKSHVEAAAELGWPLGSVKGRLARARDELRERLVRRGVTVTAAAFATLVLQDAASAAVPYPLAAATLANALTTLTPGPAVVSPGVLELAEGACPRRRLQDLLPGRTTLVVVSALLLSLLAGAWWLPRTTPRTPARQPLAGRLAGDQPADPRAAFAGRWQIVSWVESGKEWINPDNAAAASAGVNYDRLQLVLGERVIEFDLEFDPAQSPAGLDLTTEAAGVPFTQLGIYQSQGETLSLAWARHDALRPVGFDSTSENQLTVLQLRRVPLDPPAKSEPQ